MINQFFALLLNLTFMNKKIVHSNHFQDFTIKHFLRMGVQRDKLVLGIPTYGRTTILYEPNQIFRANYEEEMDMEEALAKSEGSLPYYEVRCKIFK